MTHRKSAFALAVLLACSVAAGPAWAVCDQNAASAADLDFFAMHGCDGSFVTFAIFSYRLFFDDWFARGWTDSCNINLEFAKHWNASYLLTRGLNENLNPWHGIADWRGIAEATNPLYHVDFFHTVDDSLCCFGSFKVHTIGRDEVSTHCLLYNAGSPNANPASRAGDFMHEGWHGWERRYGFQINTCGGHFCGPSGACSLTDGCDFFFFHRVRDFPFGELWRNPGTTSRIHSPNQVQIEFLCDVSEAGNTLVPASVRTAARADANQRSATRFINGPAFRCGDPKPF